MKLKPDRAFDAAFSGDGRTLVTSDDSVVVVRDVRTGRRLEGTDRYPAQDLVTDVAVDRRARLMALSEFSGTIEVVDVTQGQQLTALDLPRRVRGTASMQHLTFSPDGRWLAAGTDGGAAVVWDTRSWEVHDTWTVDGGAVQSLGLHRGLGSRDRRRRGRGGVRRRSSPGPVRPPSLWARSTTRSGSPWRPVEQGSVLVTHTDVLGVQLWQVGPQALLAHACAVAGRDL